MKEMGISRKSSGIYFIKKNYMQNLLDQQRKQRELMYGIDSEGNALTFAYEITGSTPEEKSQHKNDIITSYQNFIKEHYPKEQEKFQPEVYNFNNLEELKNSKFFKNLSKEAQELWKNTHFPIKIIVLKFKSIEDAQAFIDSLQAKNCIRSIQKPMAPISSPRHSNSEAINTPRMIP